MLVKLKYIKSKLFYVDFKDIYRRLEEFKRREKAVGLELIIRFRRQNREEKIFKDYRKDFQESLECCNSLIRLGDTEIHSIDLVWYDLEGCGSTVVKQWFYEKSIYSSKDVDQLVLAC